MSHRSSGNSLNVSENLGVVSKTSTPLSGSLENIGGGELLRKNFGTRKGLASGSQSPLVTNSRNLSNTLPRKSTPSSNLEDNHEGLYHSSGILRFCLTYGSKRVKPPLKNRLNSKLFTF